jgi:tripartite-type tricarboxylate transporter receptor subunit TctC
LKITPAPFARRQALVAAAAAAALLYLPAASAQTYPTRAVRIVVPFAAGGGTDVMARTVGEQLSKRLGQPVIVENKVGGSGMLAVDGIAKSAADGYSIVLGITGPLLTNQFLYEKMPYNIEQDLVFVAQAADAPLVLVVANSVPVKTAPELLKYMAANKGKLSYGSFGIGSYPHLAGYYMSKTTDADMVHVAYKGEALMLQDVVGGRVQMAFATALAAKALAEGGKMKMLGVTGSKRMATLPHLPTIAEQGLDDEVYKVVGFMGFAMNRKTPQPIVERLSKELQAVLVLPPVVSRFSDMGFTAHTGSQKDFENRYKTDAPVWKKLVLDSGAKVE